MKSIKTKLALFVSCLCVVLILLVWLLTVALFEPNYTRKIRKELAAQVCSVATALQSADTGSDAQALFDACYPLVRTGVCVDVSTPASLSPVFIVEKVGDNCQLHPLVGMFDEKRNWNSGTAMYMRQRVSEDGSVNLYLPEKQLMVMGTLTDNGYIVVASTNLERVDQALSVVSEQLILITVILLAVSVTSALLFARWFTRPVTELSSAAKKVAAGNYDVTVDIKSQDELGTLARDFNYMTGEIAKSTQLQRELIANISHDLRTPLTLIRGYAETIRDLNGDNKARRDEDLSVIIDESDRLSVLVNSVMELSKYSSGTEKPLLSRFDLAELAADVLRRYADQAAKEGFALAQEGLPEVEVVADPVQIGRVLHNLISNAIHHLGENGAVTVRLSQTGSAVRAEIIDNGCGIPEKELPFIFDRYYRARSDAGKQGNGLGLSIVKAILVSHGAAFGVQSAEGHGSDFWFELPAPAPQPDLPPHRER